MVTCAMQDSVLNLCRVKLRDQERLAHGPLEEYSQFGEGVPFRDTVPRAGNDSGGGQPGRVLKCKGWETDPNAYIYFITQAAVWDAVCDVIGEPTWKTYPDHATLKARRPRLNQIFARIEQWTMTKTKLEAMEILQRRQIPCGPILSMKELAEDPALRASGAVVEVTTQRAASISRLAIRSSSRIAFVRLRAHRFSGSTRVKILRARLSRPLRRPGRDARRGGCFW